MTVLLLLLVFLGGGGGAVCRYGVSRALATRYGGPFPLATMLVNTSGCFALGLLASRIAQATHGASVLTAVLATGFLGGYTTFSTYALEGVQLYVGRRAALATLNLLGSVVVGLLAAAAGAGLAAFI